MINMHKFAVNELWKQLHWGSIFENDDLLDAKELVPAIRHHPNLTDEISLKLEELLEDTLIESIRRCSLPWTSFVLDEGVEVTSHVVYEVIYNAIVDEDRISILDLFLERGWDINSLDDDGVPFINSVAHSDQLTHWFLQNGANPNISDPFTVDCALDRAAQYGSLSTISLLIRHGARSKFGAALQHATLRTDDDFTILPIMDTLIDQQPDVNAVSPDLDTALHAAVWRRSVPRAVLLLQRGADPGIRGLHVAQSPIAFAHQLGDFAMAHLLESPPHEAPNTPTIRRQDQRKPLVLMEEEFALISIDNPLQPPADDWDVVDKMEAVIEEELGVETWVVPGLEPLLRPPVLVNPCTR